MIYKDIAQYEESDSDLAKHTIMELQRELNEEIELGAEFERKYYDKVDIINKAIEYIKEYLCEEYSMVLPDMDNLLEILKGEGK